MTHSPDAFMSHLALECFSSESKVRAHLDAMQAYVGDARGVCRKHTESAQARAFAAALTPPRAHTQCRCLSR